MSDDWLRSELEALEAAAPTDTPKRRDRAPVVRRLALTGIVAASALVIAVLVGGLPDRSTGDASPSPTGGVSASARNGDFTFILSSPRSVWTTADDIQITATLSYTGDEDQVEIYGGGGPVIFSLRQLEGGTAELHGDQEVPCLPYALAPGSPLVWPFVKFGSLDDPPPFDRAFFKDPDLHLPPGRWEVRALLDYQLGDCLPPREPLHLEVSIQLDVVAEEPAASATSEGSPAATATPDATDAPLPLFDVVFRHGDDDTIRYVQDIAQGDDGLIAVVNTLHTAAVPPAGPVDPSAAIYAGTITGDWHKVETGDTFAHAKVTHLFAPAGEPMVAYGFSEEGSFGYLAWTSTDGQTWAPIDVPDDIASGDIKEGPLGYVAVVSRHEDQATGYEIYWSHDAVTWTKTYSDLSDIDAGEARAGYITDVGAGAEGFVVLGQRSGDPGGSFSLASSNGRTWFESPRAAAPSDFVYRLVNFRADWYAFGLADGEIRIWISANGLNWDYSGSIRDPGGFEWPGIPESLFATVWHAVSDQDRIILSGALAAEGSDSRPRAVWTTTDGEHWTLLDLGKEAEVRSVIRIGRWVLLGGRLGDEAGDAVVWRIDESWFP
jgi:hypothetical protein